jgi:hypothetical protein
MRTQGQFDKPGIYLFEFRGQLDASWSDWFDGFSVIPKPRNLTALVGPIEDQSALYGLIARLGHLGLLLLSVQCLSDGAEEDGHEID